MVEKVLRIAIVGSSAKHWTPVTRITAVQYIKSIFYKHVPTWDRELHWRNLALISGGADGIDTYAEVVADYIGIQKRIFEPDVQSWGGALGKRGYKQRNIQIAKTCDVLYCIDTKSRGNHSGGQWTMRYAEGLGKEAHLKLI